MARSASAPLLDPPWSYRPEMELAAEPLPAAALASAPASVGQDDCDSRPASSVE